MKTRLLIVALNPIPYHAPFFAALSKRSDVEVTVCYLDDMGVGKYVNKDWGTTLDNSDLNLLSGYESVFPKNFSRWKFKPFINRINPGVLSMIIFGPYDAVLIQGYDAISYWLAFIAGKLGRKILLFRGERVARQHRARNLSARVKRMIKKILIEPYLRSFDAVLYSCAGNKKLFMDENISADRLFPVPCAVNNDFFREQELKYLPQRDELRSSLGFSPDVFVLLMVGRNDANKRPLDLLQAVHRIGDPSLAVVYVGESPLQTEIEMFANDAGLDNVVITGFTKQTELGRHYVAGDAFILLSDYDASPKAMNEAMNFGLPVICSSVAGTAEDMIIDGVNGFLVTPGDISQLVEKIKFLINNREAAKAMGKHARKMVSEFTFEKDVEGVIKALEFVRGHCS